MKIEKLLKDTDIKEFFGLVLIAVIVGVYLYNKPDTINGSETLRIEIELATKPDYDKPNGDNVPKITFKAKGYKNYFDISHCALSLINISQITSMNVGDKIQVTVDKNDLKIKPKKLIYHPITVCGIEKANNEVILTLSDYNNCESSSWKKIIGLGAVLFVILIFMVIKKYNKYRKQ